MAKMGRPVGVTMPCGWGCGTGLTVRSFPDHFKTCRYRPGMSPSEIAQRAALEILRENVPFVDLLEKPKSAKTTPQPRSVRTPFRGPILKPSQQGKK
jgi:hypothetical protein